MGNSGSRKDQSRITTSQRHVSRSVTDGDGLASGTASNSVRHPGLSSICTKCDSLFSDRPRDLKQFNFHSHDALEVSARNGCQFCALVFASSQVAVADIDDKFKQYLNLPWSVSLGGTQDWDLNFSLAAEYKESYPRDPLVYMCSISLLQWQDESSQIRHEISHINTGSIPNMELAQNWIRVCQEFHTECTAHSKVHGLPTRLIDLGLSDADLRLSIVNPDDFRGAKYATLSHCWGQLQFLKLSRDNLASFKTSIPYRDLTQTFKDAIKVARHCAFRYLWIDSLCIIQDDRDDWAIEAPRMASVYGGSSLNISAAAANDGSEGLFFNRDPNLVQRCLVLADVNWPALSGRLSTSSYTARESTVSIEKNNSKSLIYCIESGLSKRAFELPLFRRAWVFQERFLTPRTLHFGSTQIFWECQSQLCYETLPNGVSDMRGSLGYDSGCIMHMRKGFERSWSNVVDNYSKGELTNISDKLVAISGIAESFNSRYGGTYMYGIWREHLPFALLWHPLAAHKANLLIAPTWSWASSSTPVDNYVCNYYYLRATNDRSFVRHLHIMPLLTTNKRILQVICEALLELSSHQAARLIESDKVGERKRHIDFLYLNKSLPNVTALPMDLYFDDGGRYDGGVIPPSVYALSFASESYGYEGNYIEKGLLVQPVNDRKGYCRRVGIYQMSHWKRRTFELARKIPLTEHERKFLYESVCGGENGEDVKYIINLG